MINRIYQLFAKPKPRIRCNGCDKLILEPFVGIDADDHKPYHFRCAPKTNGFSRCGAYSIEDAVRKLNDFGQSSQTS